MDILLAIVSGILMIIGLAGCFLPVLPGTPVAYAGLLILQLRDDPPFSLEFMLLWAVITALIALLDYWIPIAGAKKFGGSRWGIYGTMTGLVAGMIFFPPFGIIIGPLVGALVGEYFWSADHKKAIRAAFGSFMGFVAGTLIKVLATCVMIFYFFGAVF